MPTAPSTSMARRPPEAVTAAAATGAWAAKSWPHVARSANAKARSHGGEQLMKVYCTEELQRRRHHFVATGMPIICRRASGEGHMRGRIHGRRKSDRAIRHRVSRPMRDDSLASEAANRALTEWACRREVPATFINFERRLANRSPALRSMRLRTATRSFQRVYRPDPRLFRRQRRVWSKRTNRPPCRCVRHPPVWAAHPGRGSARMYVPAHRRPRTQFRPNVT